MKITVLSCFILEFSAKLYFQWFDSKSEIFPKFLRRVGLELIYNLMCLFMYHSSQEEETVDDAEH